jgi:hypothetical protein
MLLKNTNKELPGAWILFKNGNYAGAHKLENKKCSLNFSCHALFFERDFCVGLSGMHAVVLLLQNVPVLCCSFSIVSG